MREIELKFLDVDVAALESSLTDIGAKRTKEFFYQVRIFDFPGLSLAREKHAWVRLRDDGEEATLSYKARIGVKEGGGLNDEGMEEVEVVVSDFEHATLILKSIGMIQKFHQEKKRTRWVKGDIEYDIDTWPLLPTFLEIEGTSEEAVTVAACELGLDPGDAKICSAGEIYKVYGLDDHDYEVLTFSEQRKYAVSLREQSGNVS